MSKKPDSKELYIFIQNKFTPACQSCAYFRHGLALLLNTYDSWMEPDYSNLKTVSVEKKIKKSNTKKSNTKKRGGKNGKKK